MSEEDRFSLVISLLSPAKSLDFESPLATRKRSQPRLLDQAEAIVEVMRAKTPDEVAELMHLSEELAQLNVSRYADFTVPHTWRNARQAVLGFNGDVYQGMAAASSFDERDFTEAQKTVRILSGLYGVLRPLDLIQPYRLEMGTRVRTERGTSLYDWWGDRVTDMINGDVADAPGSGVVINLASEEYFKAIVPAKLDADVISPRFEDADAGGRYKVVSFFAKRARGSMAAWLVRNRVRTVSALKRFDVDGYRHAPDRSSPGTPVFIRERGTSSGRR